MNHISIYDNNGSLFMAAGDNPVLPCPFEKDPTLRLFKGVD